MSISISSINLHQGKGEFALGSLVQSVSSAFNGAGLNIDSKNHYNTGIFMGTTFSNFTVRKKAFENYSRGGIRAANPTEFPKGLISYLGGCLSIKFNIKGINSTFSCGCSSGLDALIGAVYFLHRDKANKALIVELGEEFNQEVAGAGDEHSCLILANTAAANKANCGDILALEAFFESKGQKQGLAKAVKRALEKSGLKKSDMDLTHDCRSLSDIANILKLKKTDSFAKIALNIMFTAQGQDANSSCLIVKLSKSEEVKA